MRNGGEVSGIERRRVCQHDLPTTLISMLPRGDEATAPDTNSHRADGRLCLASRVHGRALTPLKARV
jgi:hypothetical protein